MSRPGSAVVFKLLIAVSLWAGLSLAASAQDPPETEVYLVSVDGSGGEQPAFGEPRNLTARAGYDNQPHFLPDGRGLLYTSIREGQADIYLYDLEQGTSSAVTSTPESEFSPTPIEEGRAISVVRVEEGGEQRVWRFPLQGEAAPSVLLPETSPVGYHAWGEDGGVLLFLLGEPNTIEYRAPGEKPRVLAQNGGRTIQRVPDTSKVSYVIKSSPEGRLATFDPKTSTVELMVPPLPGREDFTWDRHGRAWMADGARLYRYCPACGGGWQQVADFAFQGIETITRLAFSPSGKQLAFVVLSPADPAIDDDE